MRYLRFPSIVLTVVLSMAGTAAAQTKAPPTVKDMKVVSLHRGSESWNVTTTVWLTADVDSAIDADHPVTFQTIPPAHGRLTCKAVATSARSQECAYEPRVGFTGTDSFRYHARHNNADSSAATVTIDVRSNGLRWELQTGTSQGLTSDSFAGGGSGLSNIPDVLGSLSQDVTFVLAWQVAKPRAKKLADGAIFDFSRSANFLVKTGLKAAETTASVSDRGSLTGSAATNEQVTTAVGSRQFSADLSLDFNAVGPINGGSSFWELGAIGRAGFDATVEPTTSVREAQNRILQVVRTDRADFRFEGGLRFVLKQRHDDDESVSFDKSTGVAFKPSNTDDLLQFELTIQRNNNLSELNPDGTAANRYAIRFIALPELPGLPGHQRLMFGVEVTQALSGGPKTVRFLYGGAFELFKNRF